MGRKPSKPPNTKPVHKREKKPPAQDGSHVGFLPPSKMLTYTVPPPNWPSTLPYLASSQLAPQLEAAHLSLLSPEVTTNVPSGGIVIPTLAAYVPASNPLVQIRQITDPAHPAYPQYGLFAARNIPAGTYIVDYTGLVHVCPLPSCATSDYDLAFLDRDSSLAIDSKLMGNEGRFVNDWHGIREEGPNAVFEEYFVKVKVKGKEVWQARMGIWVKVTSSGDRLEAGIAKGNEICVGYGKGWWRARRGMMEFAEASTEADSLNGNTEALMQET